MTWERLTEFVSSAVAEGEQTVLCTVVRLDGSGYGRPGARLAVTESGSRCGYISGGCLEKDLCRRVWPATAEGPNVIAFDTRANALDASRFRTGCEGVVFVLCRRIVSMKDPAIEPLVAVDRISEDIRTASIYRSESAELEVGRVLTDTRYDGTVSDALEPLMVQLQSATKNRSFQWADAQGNTIEAFVEVLRPSQQLVIFGAGDDVIPVVRSARQLGWRITVIGERPELATVERFPGAKVKCGPLAENARRVGLDARTDCLVMTHDFRSDVRLLPTLLQSRCRSVGLLGPKRRLGRLITELYRSGISLSETDLARLRSPVGLDIGAVTPEEIAISIIAELVALSHAREGGRLHDRRKPINDPTPHVIADERSAKELAV